MGDLELGWPVWIGVVAEHLEAQRHFYREVLGLREVDAGDDWVQFEMGMGGLFEVLAKSDAAQYSERRYQVGFAVADIRQAVEELVARGMPGAHRIHAITGRRPQPLVPCRWLGSSPISAFITPEEPVVDRHPTVTATGYAERRRESESFPPLRR